jgi:DNA-binding response OmpR family regulator
MSTVVPLRIARSPGLRPRTPRCVADWVIRSLSHDETTSLRVLLLLGEPKLRSAAAAILRQRGLDVREATDPRVAHLGQHFDVVVLDVALERSLELGRTMKTARYADSIVYVTRDAFVAETMRGLAAGAVAVVDDARDVAEAALRLLFHA